MRDVLARRLLADRGDPMIPVALLIAGMFALATLIALADGEEL